MFKRVLLAFDFSENSKAAKKIAELLVRDEGKALWVISVITPKEGGFKEENGISFMETQKSLLFQEFGDLISRGVSFNPVIRIGEPSEEILSASEDYNVDLIVIGSHSKRTFLETPVGSTTEKVAKKAKTPLLIVSSRLPQREVFPSRILLGTDFSPNAQVAFNVAISLAKENRKNLYLLTVLPPLAWGDTDLWAASAEDAENKLKNMASGAIERGINARTIVRRGDPAKEISKAAIDIGADLIVLGSHSRRNIWDVLMGNTPEKVSRIAPCPVLVVAIPAKKC